MDRLQKRLTSLILFLASTFAWAVPLQVDYYGVVASASDGNMLKMAQDVFFTQLNAIDNLKVDDKRPDVSRTSPSVPDTSSSGNSKVIFYAEIDEVKKSETEVIWKCSFKAKTPVDGKIYSKDEDFDSYYKILVSAKSSIEDLLTPLKEIALETNTETSEDFIPGKTDTLNLESLSGTWAGEPYTDKIVILRGGRGFIIFKNGATMNIMISIEKESGIPQVKVKQIGKPNASFFPELSRETALSAAVNAKPIEWTFTGISPDSLSGQKQTLVKAQTSPESAVSGIEKVVWTKK